MTIESLNYEKIASGIVVELVKLGMEEIKGIIKRRNKSKNSKKRRTRKQNS